MTRVEKMVVTRTATVRDALAAVDAGGEGIALLVDTDERLIRAITDGDLRRLILKGASLDSSIEALTEVTPVTASLGIAPLAALGIMNKHSISHLPLLDKDGRPREVILRRLIDAPVLLSSPHLGDDEIGYVLEAFRTNWIAPLGPNVDAFEVELAQSVGIGHAAAVVSGTAAIHLALRVLSIGHGDRVFCSSLTFIATASPIVYQGAEPVFIDSDPDTWNMSPTALRQALVDANAEGNLPKAVIAVNLYGQSCDMDPILAAAAEFGVPVIEDAAESLGATYKGKPSGTLGRLGIYSFNGNKIITTSGGGMLVSDDEALIAKARFLSTQAREDAPWYEHEQIGYNYRMSNVLAGIGRGQLKVLERRVEARRTVYARYARGLADIDGVRMMPEAEFGRATHWLSACTIDPDKVALSPSELIAVLRRERIEARHVWKPMHLQPIFQAKPYYRHEGTDVGRSLFETGVCLPSGSNMDVEQQDRIIDILRSALLGRGNGARA
jgi:dTDP-4-amino-4,6-dideoxygalactose transaminase